MIPKIQQLFFSDRVQDQRDLAETAWTRSRIYWILRQNASPRSVKIPDPRSRGSWIPDIPWILAHVWNEVWTESVPLLLNRICPLGQVTDEVLSRVPNWAHTAQSYLRNVNGSFGSGENVAADRATFCQLGTTYQNAAQSVSSAVTDLLYNKFCKFCLTSPTCQCQVPW